MVTIQYYGRLREQFSDAETAIALPAGIATADELRTHLATHWRTKDRDGDRLLAPSIRVVINDEICPWDTPIVKGDTIAFIPPVSGG